MFYFINPATGKGATHGGKRKRSHSTTRRRSTMARKRKHRRRGNPGPRRRRGSHRRRNPGLVPLMNRGRKRGRRRRNPFSGGGRGLLGQATQAGMDAVGIVTGKVASRAIP